MKTKKAKSESTRRVKAHRGAKTARTFDEKTGAAARRDGVAAFGKAAAAARRKRRTAADYSGEALGRPPVTGVLSLARSGAGFVSPETGGRDVFVPASAVGPALPGDLVEVRFAEGDEGAARVARVVRRGARDVVCTLRRVGRHVTAVPMTPFGGRTFHIADPGCARDGDRVVVRFSSWTNPVFNPEGEIVAVIGPENTPSLDTRTVIRAWELPDRFPEAALEEAQAAPAFLAAPGPREDLRGALVITIDPESARDYDDALSLESDAQGRAVLGVHIADVSHFVRPGTALDAEARRRGTSAYLADTVLPMLPEQLSNGVCSLVPGEDRLAFSAFLTFDKAGNMVARRFAKTVIRSSRRLTYAEALGFLRAESGDATENARGEDQVPGLVRALWEISSKLRRNRMARFSLDLSAPSLEIKLDPDGRLAGVAPAEHDEAHELVEEAMIAANEAVAAELAARRIPHLCRFHDVPDPEKLEALQTSLRALGLRVPRLSDSGSIVRLVKSARGTALEYYVSMAVLRSMKRAEYSVDNEGHFGLAKRHYSHFTSPIRRYPDLVLHRQLAAAIAGDRAAQPRPDALRAVAEESTKAEFRADQAERDLVEIKKYRFLADELAAGRRPEFDAVVLSCAPFGAFVEVPSLLIEGLVHVSSLSEGFVKFDPTSGTLVAPDASWKAGDPIRVAVSGVDFDTRKISMVALHERRGPQGGGQPQPSRERDGGTEKNGKTRRPNLRARRPANRCARD